MSYRASVAKDMRPIEFESMRASPQKEAAETLGSAAGEGLPLMADYFP